MPRRPKKEPIDVNEIFEYLRNEEDMDSDEEDELQAMFLTEKALDDVRKEERKHVFMGKANAKNARRK